MKIIMIYPKTLVLNIVGGCIYIMREYYSIQINPFVVSGGGGCGRVLYVFYECGGDVNVVFVTDTYYRHHP
jgi:hypothetical protein